MTGFAARAIPRSPGDAEAALQTLFLGASFLCQTRD